MFAFLEGEVDHVGPEGEVWLNVGGAGYEVQTPGNLDLQPGDQTRLFTAVSGVNIANRLDFLIYGFSTKGERKLFDQLTSVSGVGPSLALSVLELGEEQVISAVLSGDKNTLSQTKGVGKKTAEKIIFNLQEKLAELEPEAGTAAASAGGSTTPAGSPEQEALLALVNLDFSRSEAHSALEQVSSDGKDSAQLLREALQVLRSR